MKVALAALLVAALAASAWACFVQNSKPIIPLGLPPVYIDNFRFFSRQNGAVKCLNSTNYLRRPVCQYNYPVELFVEVALNSFSGEQTCAAAVAAAVQTGISLMPEIIPGVSNMRFEYTSIVRLEVVLYDIRYGRIIRRLTNQYPLSPSPTATSYVNQTLPYYFNDSNIMAFTAAASAIDVSTIIYDYVNEVPFMRISLVEQFWPLDDSTNEAVGASMCESFENEEFYDCELDGLNDINYEIVGRNFVKWIGNRPDRQPTVFPSSVAIFAGSIAASGDGPGGSFDGRWFNSSVGIKTFGVCTTNATQLEICGKYQFCEYLAVPPSPPNPAASFSCEGCLKDSQCAKFSQALFPGSCLDTSPNQLCTYLPGPVDSMPSARPDPDYDINCGLDVCEQNTYCLTEGGCTQCRNDADCVLSFSQDGTYKATCTSSTCKYSFPTADKTKASIKKVAIAAGCAAGGVVLIGAIVGGAILYKKRSTDIAKDNVMSDALGKQNNKPGAKAKKDDPFADATEMDLKGKKKSDPFA